MTKTARRALAAATISALAAGALTAGPVASAGSGNGRTLTNYGMKGTAVGGELYVNNVKFLSAKDAVAPLRCTRMAGRTATDRSMLSTPENSLIDLSESTSKTITYRTAGRSGIRATNTLGDVKIGGQLPGQKPTPIFTIEGLKTVADAFHTKATKKGFGHEETFSAPKINIDLSVLTDNGVPEELQQVVDAINDASGQLTGAVVEVIQEVQAGLGGALIEIPELGAFGMGVTKGHANKRGAESDATSLIFEVTATGEKQVLSLGHSRAVINGPAKGGVFRSTSMPLDLKIADGTLHFGEVRPHDPVLGHQRQPAHQAPRLRVGDRAQGQGLP